MTAPGACHGCAATFRGRQNHCTRCHQTFASERAGDDHRVGPYDPPARRRCLTPDELRAAGLWQDDRGVWHGQARRDGRQQRRTPPKARAGTTTPTGPENADTARRCVDEGRP